MSDKAIDQNVRVRETGVKYTDVLGMIAQGYSYGQILNKLPDLTMGDIMAAAELARQVLDRLEDVHGRLQIHGRIKFAFSNGQAVLLEDVRQESPRAFRPWTDREENNLAEAYKHGVKIDQLARRHQRQPGAIRARLERLGLTR